jgi:hypothetical protein
MVTIVAQAGVGKSRLTEEFFDHIAPTATTLRGRCLPYGRGITFWPLVEIVRQAAAIMDEDTPEVARGKIASLGGDAGVTERVAAAVGLDDGDFPVPELFWGVRKLFESIAADRPLALRFDDIHWAEATLLDLIAHLRTPSTDVPLLVLCATRPDLLERRDWTEVSDATIELAPLGEDDAGSRDRARSRHCAVPGGGARAGSSRRPRATRSSSSSSSRCSSTSSCSCSDEDGWHADGGPVRGACPARVDRGAADRAARAAR